MLLAGAHVRFTGRAEGDLGHAGRWVAVDDLNDDVVARRRAVLDRPWSWLRQVHGDRVVVVDEPGGQAGEQGDALVTADRGAALAVLTADCAPVVLAGQEGVVAVVHAGWRGLEAGVVGRAVATMRAVGASDVTAALGPCIRPECYEFSPADLDRLVDRLGAAVRGETSDGRPALDVPAAVANALGDAGVALVHDEAVCTSCSSEHFSHRARGELERQATLVWLP